MTTKQIKRAMLSQCYAAARYLTRFEQAEAAGDQREACRMYVLWQMHTDNAKLWASRLPEGV